LDAELWRVSTDLQSIRATRGWKQSRRRRLCQRRRLGRELRWRIGLGGQPQSSGTSSELPRRYPAPSGGRCWRQGMGCRGPATVWTL